jgi:hypothetical protein
VAAQSLEERAGFVWIGVGADFADFAFFADFAEVA